MTVIIFLGSLLGAMALGIPIAYSLLASGVALMWHLDMFDAQILAQNVINGADSFRCWPCRSSCSLAKS
jgi:hypothetical protein